MFQIVAKSEKLFAGRVSRCRSSKIFVVTIQLEIGCIPCEFTAPTDSARFNFAGAWIKIDRGIRAES